VNVSDTSLRFVDKTRGIDQKIEDLTLALPFVSTLPAERESIVTPKLSLKLNGTPIVATGSTRPFGQSLEAQLRLNVSKLDVVPLLQLVPALRTAPAHLQKGLLTSDLSLVFRNPTGGNPAQLLVSGKVGLDDVLVEQRVAGKDALLLSAKSLTVDAKEIDPIGQKIDINTVAIESPKANLTMGDGVLAATASASDAAAPQPSSQSAEAASTPWAWSLGTLSVRNGTITWHDGKVRPAVNMTVSNLKADLTKLTSAEGAAPAGFALSARVLDGTTNLKGTVSLSPLKVAASLSGDKINFRQAAGYVQNATGLDVAGLANFTVNARHDEANTTASGNLTLTRITVKNRLDTLLSLKNANVAVSAFDLAKKNVAVDTVLFDTVMVNLRNTKSGLNLPFVGGDTADKKEAAPKTEKVAEANAAAPWNWSLGKATLRNATVNYKDQTTSPQTAISVSKLQVSAQKFSSAKDNRGDLSLSANVAGGSLSVKGKAGANPVAANLALTTKNLQLSPFSPLARKFAGYGAKSGTLNVAGDLALAMQKDTPVVEWKGDASLTTFDLVDAGNKSLATLNGLRLTGMDVDTKEPLRAAVKTLVIEKPGTKETKQIEKVAEIASIFGALTGKRGLEKQAGKVNKVLNARITLNDLKYENGRVSAAGLDRDALAKGIVDALNDAIAKKTADDKTVDADKAAADKTPAR
ncbi:MAG TPA: DUF748 domain-containing protein, partial [Candidatus Sutterella merdavium]|nr:DUF748 domain-containing protein [Candidatus Sutterella merdavium]